MTDATQAELNSLFIFLSGVLVFFMHAGFGMLEVGGVQAKNSKNILLKNLLNICFSAVAWYFLGYTLANGPDSKSHFIGWTKESQVYIAAADLDKGADFIGWFFGFAFAATAATIVSGALAERTQFRAYFLFAMLLTGWIYPVVAYWAWSASGWLKLAGNDDNANNGFLDFAGSGVVHMVGGMCALVGAYFVGPRKYLDTAEPDVYVPRFEVSEDGAVTVNQPIQNKSNPSLSTVGTMILWFGWYGFNCGSQLAFTGSSMKVVSLAMMNTTLAPAAAVITIVIFTMITGAHVEVGDCLNAALGGLVSITANCNIVEPWAALIIGSVGGMVYLGSASLLLKLQIDDVINASPVHFFCGMWALIATGFFAEPHLAGLDGHESGVFYGGGKLLGWQLCGLVSITLWCGIWSGLIFGAFSYFGQLRVGSVVEKAGLDNYNKVSGEGVPDFGSGPQSPNSSPVLTAVEQNDLEAAIPDKKTTEVEMPEGGKPTNPDQM
jgi:Amt family ammonium transporter